MKKLILTFILLCSAKALAYETVTAPFVDSSQTESVSSFPTSYAESRTQFLDSMHRLTKVKAQITSFKVPSRKDTDLTVDIAYLQATKKTKNLVILMAGVHGGEAYAANAVLSQFIQNSLPELNNEQTGFIFVHALNPYGFKYFHRTTENNIDLNRNFPLSEDLYSQSNEQYKEIRNILVEEIPLRILNFHNITMLPRVGWLLVTKPKGFLLQATAGGQYIDPKGLFYGGNKPEPQIIFLQDYLKKTGSKYQNIYYVDLHTGYGKKGVLHLFGSTNLSEKHKTFTEKVFADEKIDYGSDKNFYKTSGDSVAFISALFKDKNVSAMCFEFGTLDSQTTIGSFRSLQTLRFESQGFLHGYATAKDHIESTEMSIRMFAPQNSEWRNQVLEQGEKQLDKSLQIFLNQ